ncbi:MAG: hypothetical protein II768_10080 [Clostridia bacterium]|nr:hypothetical protein [Clostridia bacterium]MBR5366756.1 hypothetical protein [Clostridia bacterium]
MDHYDRYVVQSWLTLAAVLLGILLLLFLIPRVLRFLRTFFKRTIFLNRLKKTCRAASLPLSAEKSPYRSLFGMTKAPELRIDLDDHRFYIKLVTLPVPAATYLLKGTDRLVEVRHWKPRYLNLGRPVPVGPAGRSETASAFWTLYRRTFPALVETNTDYPRDLTPPSYHLNLPEDGETVLCLNPISQEMVQITGSRADLLYDGAILENGIKVYSGAGLLKLLAETSREFPQPKEG